MRREGRSVFRQSEDKKCAASFNFIFFLGTAADIANVVGIAWPTEMDRG